MAFNGKEGKPITLGMAKRWTKRYRDENPGKVKAFFFGKDHIKQILLEGNGSCQGIRVYFATDDDGNQRLILTGADAKQNNILPKSEGKDGGPTLLDDGKPCPPYCPEDPSDPLSN